MLPSGLTLPGHVLVVGVDGVRFDFLGPDGAPSVWALGQAGFLAQVPVDEATPTWSGPCWATIATGTGVAGHGITGNDLTGHRLAEHPDFVTRATRAGLPTLLAVSGWPPLALAEDGGPLFAEASSREFTAVPRTGLAWDAARETSQEDGLAAWDAADEDITARAAAILAGQAPRVSFVYLGAVDFAGHAAGSGATYRAALLAADQRVGRLVATVRARPSGPAGLPAWPRGSPASPSPSTTATKGCSGRRAGPPNPGATPTTCSTLPSRPGWARPRRRTPSSRRPGRRRADD